MWIRLIALVALISAPALAHHSVGAFFDASTTIELEGEITEVAWRNPHILFEFTSSDGEAWTLETHSLSIMRRLEAPEPFVAPGDQVRVAGWRSRRGQGMFVNNMLLPNGEEFVFKFQPEPADLMWSDRMWGTTETWFAEGGDESAEELGIFRTWSSTLHEGAFLSFFRTEYPLTEEAQAFRAAFNPTTDDPLLNCGLKGMPGIMGNPYPLAFHDRGDTIEIQIEEYDTIRTVYLNADTAPEPEASIYGHSTGRWEGDSLVVETTYNNWGHVQARGVPLSDDVHMLERFTVTDNGGRLDYAITITDEATFTEPVTLDKYWVYVPGVSVEPYECIPN
ncbi:MAG: DUF6152 family protein [Gammaproteobacteria bacterium]